MKKYISAEMQIIKISANDIIATSDPATGYSLDPTDNMNAQGRGIWDEDYNGYNY